MRSGLKLSFLLSVLVLGACGSDSAGPGSPSYAKANDVTWVPVGNIETKIWLERGPQNDLAIVWRSVGVDVWGNTFIFTDAHVSTDEGSSWTNPAFPLVKSSLPALGVPPIFTGSGLGGIQAMSESNLVLGPEGQWQERTSIFDLLDGATDENWNIQADHIADFRIDKKGRRHYLTSSLNKRLFYHIIDGDQRTSYPVHDTEFAIAGLALGAADEAWAIYQDSFLEFKVQQLGPAGLIGPEMKLPVKAGLRGYLVKPSLDDWALWAGGGAPGEEGAHIAVLVAGGDLIAVCHVPVTAQGLGTITVLGVCDTAECVYSEVSVESDLALYDDTLEANPHIFVARRTNLDPDGTLEEVLISRLDGALPSPLDVSSGVSKLKQGGAMFDFNDLQVMQWPVVEFAYFEDDRIRYLQGGIEQDEGWSFDKLVMTRVLASTPSYVTAWFSSLPDAGSLDVGSCAIEPSLPILSATLTPIGAGIVLHTGPQAPGQSYTLTCGGVSDANGRASKDSATFIGFGTEDWDTYSGFAAIHSLAVDHEGGLWSTSQHGVDRFGPERAFWEHMPLEFPGVEPFPEPPGHLAVSADGRVWVDVPTPALQDKFAVWDGGWTLFEASLMQGAQPGHDRNFFALGDGSIWVPTDGWLHRIDLPDVESIDLAGSTIEVVSMMARAPGGPLWAVAVSPVPADKPVPDGVHVGLSRLDGEQWTHLEKSVMFDDGRKGEFAALAVDGDGVVWALANVAYEQMGNTGFTTHLASRNEDGSWTELAEVNPGAVHLEVDVNGRVWGPGLTTNGPDGVLPLPTPYSTGAISSDQDGSVWTTHSGPFPQAFIGRRFISEAIEESFVVSACEQGGEPISLTVSLSLEGEAVGSVTSKPAGIACPGKCTATFPKGCPVRLSASATVGKLLEWTAPCSGGGDCVIVMNEDTEVGANFSVPLVPWSVALPTTDNTGGHIEGVAADAEGALTLAGRFRGAVEVDGQSIEGVSPTLANLVVAHFAADLKPLWTKRIGSADGVLGQARLRLAPNGDVLIATVPTGGDLDVGEGSLGPGSGRDMVIVRYAAASGEVVYVRRHGKVASSAYEGTDIDVDGSGQVYAVASSAAGLDFGAGFVSEPGGFLLSLAADGSINWLSQALAPVKPYLVAAAADGRTVVAALYDNPVDFGVGDPLPYDSNFTNLALVGLDEAGAVIWARTAPEGLVDLFVAPDGSFAVITEYPKPETTLLDDQGQPKTVWSFGAAWSSVAVSSNDTVALVGAGTNDWSGVNEPDTTMKPKQVSVLDASGQLLWGETVAHYPTDSFGGAAWRGEELVVGGSGYAKIGFNQEALAPPDEDVQFLLYMAGLAH